MPYRNALNFEVIDVLKGYKKSLDEKLEFAVQVDYPIFKFLVKENYIKITKTESYLKQFAEIELTIKGIWILYLYNHHLLEV